MVSSFYAGKSPDGKFDGSGAPHDFREDGADDMDAVRSRRRTSGTITVAAAEAARHLFIAAGELIPEGRAVVDACRYRRVFQTGSHERSRDNARFGCELVRNGRIGKLHTISVNLPIDNHGPIGNQPEMPVPEELDYNFWLGPAREAPYTEKRCHFYFRYIMDYSGEMTGARTSHLGQLGNGTDDTPVSVEGKAGSRDACSTRDGYTFQFEHANGVVMKGACKARAVRFEGSDG